MVHICLAQINRKWRKKWPIKIYHKKYQMHQWANKGLTKGSKGQKSQEIQGKGKKIGREIIGSYRTFIGQCKDKKEVLHYVFK